MADTLTVPFLEIKSLGEREFEGYGSTFGNPDLGNDIVVRGAFTKSLANRETPVLQLWMHDPTRVPGKWSEIREDQRGLYVKGELARTPLGDEARELLRMGALAGLSIGFLPVDVDYDTAGRRLLKEIDLREISIVSMPMNPKATVSSAKLRDICGNVRDWEKILKFGFGLSNRAATRAASRTWKSLAEELSETADLDAITAELAEDAAAISLQAAANRIRRIA